MPLVEFQLFGACSAIACRQQKNWSVFDQRIDAGLPSSPELRQFLRLSHDDVLETFAEHTGQSELSIPCVAVPFQNAPVEETDAERRALFERNLDFHIAEAFDTPEDEIGTIAEETDEPAEPKADAACMTCQGRCCRLGASHAFLKGDTLQKQRLRQPGITPEALKSYFMDQLPAMTTSNACVFQGAQGCTMKREDRSSTCNSYTCSARGLLARMDADADAPPVLLVAIEDGAPKRINGVDGAGQITQLKDLEA